VKAFCNLSAYSLLHGDTLTDNMRTVAASDDAEVRAGGEQQRAAGVPWPWPRPVPHSAGPNGPGASKAVGSLPRQRTRVR
jgi:hypothetical protein